MWVGKRGDGGEGRGQERGRRAMKKEKDGSWMKRVWRCAKKEEEVKARGDVGEGEEEEEWDLGEAGLEARRCDDEERCWEGGEGEEEG